MNGASVRVSTTVSLVGTFTVIHTVYKDRWFRVTCIHVANVTGADDTLQVCIVPSGGTPVSGSALVWNFTVPKNDFCEFGESLWLAPASSIQALCATPHALNFHLSGLEN